ncbi:MAG: hypothetical protein Ct9H300mP31_15900 [Acidimicrobiaceae bacterium]|nr:MAG: hypothetical protein Ct9H300mP31_15900 [Acidimicrobiaceae bacterium]
MINGLPTEMDHLADVVVRGSISEVSPRVVLGVGPAIQGPWWANPDLLGRISGMATFRDLLADARSHIRETDPAGAEALLADGHLLLDVREPDEYEQGAIPDSLHIPRGNLESNVENRVTDRDQPIVVMCAGGVRSAFAADTLQQFGYTDVVSMEGGFNRWKDEGRDWRTPRTLSPEQRNRYQRHLLLPEVGEEGQLKLLDASVLMLGAGGPLAHRPPCPGRPPASAVSASSTWTWSTSPTSSASFLHNRDRVGERKVDSAKKTLPALNPDVDVVTYDCAWAPTTSWTSCPSTTWWWTGPTTSPAATSSTTPR